MGRCRSFRWLFLLHLVVFHLSTSAHTAVLYVNKNAAGAAHDGASWSTAFLTVQAGVNAAKPGDEVWVGVSLPAAPAYTESITMGNGVSLYGGFAGTETQRTQRDSKTNVTIIDGNQADVVVTVPSTVVTQVVIDGFTIRNGSAGSTAQDGCGVLASSPAIISNNAITGNGGIGVYACLGTTILNDVICGNGGNGVTTGGTDKYLGVTISSSTICGNIGNGVYLGTDQANITGDTICGNGADGLAGYGGKVTVVNTVLAFNGRYGVVVGSFAPSAPFLSNDVYGNSLGAYSGFTPVSSAGNVSVDPKLNSIYYNVHLQPGSPCIDAGIDSYVVGTTDIDGQARKTGAHVDIGSDESDGTIWPATGPNLFVSPTGSDAADGLTWPTAKKTVTAALSVAQAGSAVWVAKGTYVESVTFPFDVGLYGGFDGTESDLSQRNVTSNPTVLDGGGTSGDVVTCSAMNVVVDGFTVRNGGNGVAVYGGTAVVANNAVSGNSTNGVFMHGGTAALSNNTITGNAVDGVYLLGVATLTDNAISRNGTGVYVGNYSTADLTGNNIAQNSTTGVEVYNDGSITMVGNSVFGNEGVGVKLDSSAIATLTGNNVSANGSDGVKTSSCTAVLANNVVSENGQDGVYSEAVLALTGNIICGNGQDGIYSYREAHLTNNTIVGNGRAGINTAGVAVLMNNVIATNSGYGVNNTGAISAFSQNDVYGNAGGDYNKFTPPFDKGNISADPKLSNIYHDIHLQPGSPCIDAGDDSAVTGGQTDVYRKPRVIGAHVDIGADESDGTVWTVPSRVWFVSTAGSDSADGQTWGTAKRTVTGALSVSQGGDDIWVAKGTYIGNVVIPRSVALYGGFAGTEMDRSERNPTANPTVLDGGGGSLDVVTACFNTVVDSFTIRSGGNGVSVKSGRAMLINDTISGNTLDGVYVSDGSAVVTNNVITGNGGAGVFVSTGSATLVNDTISSNCGTGVATESPTSIYNSVIARNGGWGVYIYSSLTQPVCSHNDVFGNSVAQYYNYTPPTNMGNISVDPKLSSIYHDIHLQPGSPCIDAGDDSTVTPGQTDAYGKPRIIGAHVDIGADESGGTVWTVPSHVWFVSPSGSDAADGLTWGTAKRTVTGALYVSQGGDEVWVAKGTYIENVRVPNSVGLFGGFGGTETDRSERSPTTNPTVLDGGGGTTDVIDLPFSNAIVDSLTIRNGRYGAYIWAGSNTISNSSISGNAFGGVTLKGGQLTLLNNSISGNGSRGGVEAPGGTLTLVNNTVFGNAGPGVDATGVAILSRNTIYGNAKAGVFTHSTATLAGNRIYGNTLDGVYIYGTASLTNNVVSRNGGRGVFQQGGTSTLANNTISDNASDGISVYSSTAGVTNNIVAFNGGYGVRRGIGSLPAYSHNDVYGNTVGQYSNYTPPANKGNISVDPLFADRTVSDYHLLVGSPCIDAGDDSALASTYTDVSGNPRKMGAHVDIGAYEFAAPGCYTLADAVRALRVAAGLTGLDNPGFARLNVVTEGGSASVIDVSDAVLLIRKLVGPDPNP